MQNVVHERATVDNIALSRHRRVLELDRFGATLGTIKIEDTIDIYYRLSFENGCLRMVDSYPNGKTDAVNALYLPTGEQIS